MKNYTEFVENMGRMSILKAKAAITCNTHPDILIRANNPSAEQRAYTIAQNTLCNGHVHLGSAQS